MRDDSRHTLGLHKRLFPKWSGPRDTALHISACTPGCTSLNFSRNLAQRTRVLAFDGDDNNNNNNNKPSSSPCVSDLLPAYGEALSGRRRERERERERERARARARARARGRSKGKGQGRPREVMCRHMQTGAEGRGPSDLLVPASASPLLHRHVLYSGRQTNKKHRKEAQRKMVVGSQNNSWRTARRRSSAQVLSTSGCSINIPGGVRSCDISNLIRELLYRISFGTLASRFAYMEILYFNLAYTVITADSMDIPKLLQAALVFSFGSGVSLKYGFTATNSGNSSLACSLVTDG